VFPFIAYLFVGGVFFLGIGGGCAGTPTRPVVLSILPPEINLFSAVYVAALNGEIAPAFVSVTPLMPLRCPTVPRLRVQIERTTPPRP